MKMKKIARVTLLSVCGLLAAPAAGLAGERPAITIEAPGAAGRAALPDADLVFGLTTTGRLVSFAVGAPNTLLSNVQITGLNLGETIVGIDFRPATEELYGVTDGSRVVRIDTATGAVTAVGAAFSPPLVGVSYGVDFNPTVDRIRVVNDLDQNVRLHPDTGALVADDLALHYAAGDANFGVSPNLSGLAYSNNSPAASVTTLFGIDFDADVVVIQNPPNDGTLTTVGGLGFDTSDLVGFDIQSRSGTAFASLTAPSATFSQFFTVDLGTGLVTLIGTVGGIAPLRDIALSIALKRGADTVGTYVAGTGAWFLRNSNSAGPADISFLYGPGGTVRPVVGDYNADGVDTPGVYDPATGVFFLRNSNSAGAADLSFQFGAAGLGFQPLIGDWNGNGDDTVGLYNPATGTFFLKNSNQSGVANLVFTFGPGGAGFVAIVGDWNSDGIDTVGIYNPATGVFFLRNTNSNGPADAAFGYGPTGVVPIAGDYDNNASGTIGIYDAVTGSFFLRNSNTPGAADLVFGYGSTPSTPIVGDWDDQ
ncbi:MAG: DUF4394 domain-containing protein [Acidobacteria bacterium]|nr:DUF4394 domain-containing protein [Acidobacteriota bacterium]